MKKIAFMLISLYMGLMGANAQSNKFDLNEDGHVNITDVIELVNYILGLNNGNPSGGGNESNAPEGVEAIDLGLPSGTKWASCNVGATKPYEYGGYYAWGETSEKKIYNWSTYIHCDGSKDTCHDLGSDISGTEYDVAHVLWGGNWCMPTFEQCKELRDNCTIEWTALNGVDGRKFISKVNGNSIFLPAAGGWGQELSYEGENGFYWSSTQDPSRSYLAYNISFYSEQAEPFWNCFIRENGQSVRPVLSPDNFINLGQDDNNEYDLNEDGDVNITDVILLVNYILNQNDNLICPDSHHPHMIDLGLPSGTKWACCNVGATKPEEYGGYYAWGETEEKGYYDMYTYMYYEGSYDEEGQWVDIGSDISGTEYDVAHVKWGGNWCMPTFDDIKELRENCTYEWTTLNGEEGGKFTSNINGNSIFLPAAGFRMDGDLEYLVCGYYWSSEQHPSNTDCAYYLFFNDGDAYWGGRVYYYRNVGYSVRPVWKE